MGRRRKWDAAWDAALFWKEKGTRLGTRLFVWPPFGTDRWQAHTRLKSSDSNGRYERAAALRKPTA